MTRATPPASVLGRLLEAAGYRLESRPEGTLASRAIDRRAVMVVASSRSPAEVEDGFPLSAVHRTIVYDDEPGEAARALASDRGIEVLTPSTLGPALAELLLPSPAAPSPEAAGPDDEPPTLAAPVAVVPEGERIVRPRIGRPEAESLAGVDASRYTLRLVPYYVGRYRIRAPSPHGGAGPVLHRIVAVNAVSRRAEVWEDGDRELVSELTEPHQRLVAQLAETAAIGTATELIRRHHAVDVEHTEQHGGALVIETRRVLPSSEELRLGPLSLLYVPFWYAEGVEGRIVLDAVTGHRVSPSESGDP
jgi:hypothetical protein